MSAPLSSSFADLAPLDWACIAYNIILALAGVLVLRRWRRLGGVRHEPDDDSLVPVGMIILSVIAFAVVFPFTMQAVLPLFLTEFGVSQADSFIATIAGQAAAAAVMLFAWLALPQAVSWAPTIAPEGEQPGPVDHLRPAWRAFGLRPWGRGFLAVCAFALGGALTWKGIHLGWEKLHAAGLAGDPPVDELQDIVEIAMRTDVLTPKFLLLTAAVVIGAPLMEELVFRGGLYPAIKFLSRRGLGDRAPMFAAVLTGALFSWVHMTPSAYLPLFLFGWFLCLVRDRYGLLTCMAIHAAFNLSNLAWLKLAPDVANL